MSGQYFENNKNLKSDKKIIDYFFLKEKLLFLTDYGVFSKGEIDYGSSLLIKSITAQDPLDILDVGCGYGPIGICMAKKYPQAVVDMIDVNERALDLCKENAKKNRTQNVSIFLSHIYEKIEKKYDLIISNPPIRSGKENVLEIVLSAEKHLKANGKLVVVIKKEHGAKSYINRLKEVYDKVNIINKDKGYNVIECMKESNYEEKN